MNYLLSKKFSLPNVNKVHSSLLKFEPFCHVNTIGWWDLTTFMAVIKNRTESTGCPDQACRWEDWVDCPVQFHVSIYAANSAFLRSNDSHLHFAIINECVQDGLNVLHGQLYLTDAQFTDVLPHFMWWSKWTVSLYHWILFTFSCCLCL